MADTKDKIEVVKVTAEALTEVQKDRRTTAQEVGEAIKIQVQQISK